LYNYFHEKELDLDPADYNQINFEITFHDFVNDIINKKIYDFYNDDIIDYILPTQELKDLFNKMFKQKNQYLHSGDTPTLSQKETESKIKAEDVEFTITDVRQLSSILSLNVEQFEKDLDTIAVEGLLPDLMDEMEDNEFNEMFLKKVLSGYQMSASELVVQKPHRDGDRYTRLNFVLYKLSILPQFELYYYRNKFLKKYKQNIQICLL